jgi:hypothetical protein
MVTISLTGPQLKTPTKAPIEVATEGITVVWSISVTFTPGERAKAMFYSF